MKALISILLVLSAGCFAKPVVVSKSPNKYDAQRPEWIVDGMSISTDYVCRIALDKFIPEKYCDKTIRFQRVENGDGSISRGSKMSYSNFSLDEITDLAQDPRIIDAFLNEESPVITIEKTKLEVSSEKDSKKEFVLEGFKSESKKYFELISSEHDTFLREAVNQRVMIYIFLGIFIFVVIVFVKKIALPATKSIAIKSVDSLDNRRVRRIAEDEAIRHSVRESMNAANEVELERVKKEIVSALEAGDTKTASHFMDILNSIENEKK
ncbi:hypothetical protein [Deefgea piscis]|uniref:hypothetical protein n=1 Tax=Deefgea piscis TaxID=2739061 RepID=UPI001C81CFD8|nr:hypothetical protein [Deefgea piscis]QZA82132.1 hypothetical protein K4H25_05670 [Deefgea piscis]